MSSGDVRKVTRQDIQFVQNLIKRCLQLYMNQKEVVDILLYRAKIEPGFTELVWQKLEEENQEFFKAYHVRLLLKNQILVFNKLLEKQIELMHKALPPGVASVPDSNSSGSSTLHQTPPCYLSDHASTSSRPDNMFCNGGSPSSMMNGASSGNQSIQLPNGASILIGSTQNSHIQRPNGMNGTTIKSEPSYSNNSDFPFCNDDSFMDTLALGLHLECNLHQTPPCYLSDHGSTSSRPDNMFCNGGSPSSMMNGASSGNQSIQLPNGASILIGSTQNSHVQRPNGMNGTTIKSEPSYSNNSDFPFCNDDSFMDTQAPIGSSSELNGQPLNEPLMDNDTSSFVLLSQIPQSFSFSDLTEDFTQSADILENYRRSPFLGSEPNNFSDSPRREYQEDRRLDTISEGVSYDEFGSD